MQAQNPSDLIEAFSQALRDTFFLADSSSLPCVIADGSVHRFHIPSDSPGTLNGWYVLHMSGSSSYGAYGSWRGPTHGWRSDCTSCITFDQRTSQELESARARARAASSEDQRLRQHEAALKAAVTVSAAFRAEPDHPYLVRKRINPYGALQRADILLLPIKVAGGLTSLQSIDASGTKRFLPGGRISGGYHLIRGDTISDEVVICEGFATGSSLFEHTGATTFCALNAGNLAAVARFVRATLPDADIVICADNDAWTPGNPGVYSATTAADLVSGRVLVPDFSCYDQSSKPTDWNDLACLAGCLPSDLVGGDF
jgi:putative DNA primase/helicase